MSKKVFDFQDFKDKKELKEKDTKNKELFKAMCEKRFAEFGENEFEIFKECNTEYSGLYGEKYYILILRFRRVDYVVHNMGSRFEYLGTFNEILDEGLYNLFNK